MRERTARAMAHDHDHDDHHEHGSELSEMQLRVRALETVLTEKGYIDPAALDAIDRGLRDQDRSAQRRPRRRQSLERSGSSSARCSRTRREAVQSLGVLNRVGDHLIAVENTPKLHNMIVCTLCSCYPWEVLGLPPVWYKSAPYRSRAVNDPRGVLADFGVSAAGGFANPGLGFDRGDALHRICRCGRPAPTAGAKRNSPRWSRATA